MKPNENLEESIKQLRQSTTLSTDERILDDACAALEESTQARSASLRIVIAIVTIVVVIAAVFISYKLFSVSEKEPARKTVERGDEAGQKVSTTKAPKPQPTPPVQTEAEKQNAKLKNELMEIMVAFTAVDIDTLVRILEEGEFQSRILAARCLGKIGNERAIASLEKQYLLFRDKPTPKLNANIFEQAIEQIKSRLAQEKLFDANTAGQQKVTDPNKDGKDTLGGALVSADGNTADGILTGYVRDISGVPIEGAVVESFFDRAESITDTNGFYRLKAAIRQPKQSLLAHCGGYEPAWIEHIRAGTEEQAAEVDFTLEEGHWLEITVVDEDGVAVADVNVTAGFSDANDTRRLWRTLLHQTDEAGVVYLEDLPGPKVRLWLMADGWSSIGDYIMVVNRQVTITMQPFMIILGQLLDADTELPVTDFRIEAKGVNVPKGLSKGKWYSDPNGNFSIEMSNPTSLELVIEAEGYPVTFAGEASAVPASAAQEHVFYLDRGQLITGILIDESSGEPLADVTIVSAFVRNPQFYKIDWTSPENSLFAVKEIITDENGRFSFLEELFEINETNGEDFGVYEKIRTLLIQLAGYENKIILPADRLQYQDESQELRILLSADSSTAQ